MTQDKNAGQTQASILHLIQAHPGIHKSRIQRRLGLGWGTICFHADRLLEAKTIHAVSEGARVHLFAGPRPGQNARRAVAVQQRHSREILELLRHRPLSSVSSLARATGAARRTIRIRLLDLQSVGLVQASQPPSVRYTLGPEAKHD